MNFVNNRSNSDCKSVCFYNIDIKWIETKEIPEYIVCFIIHIVVQKSCKCPKVYWKWHYLCLQNKAFEMFVFGCARFIPLRLVFLPHILCACKMYWKYNFNTQRRRQSLRRIFSKLLKFFGCVFICERRSRLTFSDCVATLRNSCKCWIFVLFINMLLHTNCFCSLILIECVLCDFLFSSDFSTYTVIFNALDFRNLLFFMLALFCAYLFYVDISSVASIEITFLRDSVDTSYDYGAPKLNRGSENCVCILQVFK